MARMVFLKVASGWGVAVHILHIIHLCVPGSFNNSGILGDGYPHLFPWKTTKNAETKIVLLTLETWKEVLEFPSFFRFTLDTLDSPPKDSWKGHGTFMVGKLKGFINTYHIYTGCLLVADFERFLASKPVQLAICPGRKFSTNICGVVERKVGNANHARCICI